MSHDRTMTVGEVFRYTKPNAPDRLTHSHRSFWDVQSSISLPRVMLESGINGAATVNGPEGPRMPLLALRSSPGKAGTAETPWHDEFNVEEGRIRYFGDHRIDSAKKLGETTGDVRLEGAWKLHRATSPAMRAAAPPILVFRTVTGETTDGPQVKGFVEFVGLAVMTDLRAVEQRDTQTSRHFMNYVTALTLLELGEHDRLNWDWIDARRDPSLTSDEALSFAPEAWKAWVSLGLTALPTRTRLKQSQVPTLAETATIEASTAASSDAESFPFPWVAARVVEQLLGIERTRMMTGLERDGVVVFRGTHRLGSGTASASLRVVAVASIQHQAAVAAASSILRNLEAGQIGVLVTPSPIPEANIRSLKTPGAPLLVLAGDAFRAQVLQIAEQSFDGDAKRLEGSYADASVPTQ